MNNGRYIQIYPIYFPFCPGYYTLSTFLSGLFHNGHNCAPELRRAQTPLLLPRAGKLPELLHRILGLGNSVISTASGHRVHSGRLQDITLDLYLLSGEDGIYRDYHYGILQSREINFNYLCFNFGAFLTKVNKRTSTFLKDYTWDKAKK